MSYRNILRPALPALLLMIMLSLALPAYARGEAADNRPYQVGEPAVLTLPGVEISREEGGETLDSFTDRMTDAVRALTAPSGTSEETAGPEENGLAQAVLSALSAQQTSSGDDPAGKLADRIEASRLSAGEAESLFALSAGGLSAVGTYTGEYGASLFLFAPDEADAPEWIGQLVFTEWGGVIGLNNPEAGVLRPDGSFAVLAAGETCVVLMDADDLSVLDRFVLTVLPEGVEGRLQISLDGEAIESASMKVGESMQLSVGLAVGEAISAVRRATPEDGTTAIALPESLTGRIRANTLAELPGLPENQPDRPALRIVG